MKLSSQDVVTWIQADYWPQALWGFDNGIGFGKCMCVVSKMNLTWLAASGISELPRSAADILYKLFPLSWYIKQLCSAAKELIWSCLRKCDKLMESFPFSFRLWDDLSALCGKFCFFYSVVLIMRTQIYLQMLFPGFHAGKFWFHGVFSNLRIKLLFTLRSWNQSIHYLRTLQWERKAEEWHGGNSESCKVSMPRILGMSVTCSGGELWECISSLDHFQFLWKVISHLGAAAVGHSKVAHFGAVWTLGEASFFWPLKCLNAL